MKRIIAAIVLLASLGVILKFGAKRSGEPEPAGGLVAGAEIGPEAPPVLEQDRARLLERYPTERALVERVVERYGPTAVRIERTDGLRGLRLLDRLDLEAIFLYEHAPSDFRRLASLIGDEAASEVLLGWREYFGLKRADMTDRAVLIRAIERLNTRQRRAAAAYPNALPLILSDPRGVAALIERLDREPEQLQQALAVLMCVDLSDGSTSLRSAVRTIDDYGDLALDAFRLQGLEGFATVRLFGPILVALQGAVPLDDALIALRVNEADLSDLRRDRSARGWAMLLEHLQAEGLIEAVAGDPHGLRLAAEYGDLGERALREAGPFAASLVYERFEGSENRRRAVEALADHGRVALAILAKYASDPSFREILLDHGSDVVPPIARSDAAPELVARLRSKSDRTKMESLALALESFSADSGQKTIERIRADGLDRAVDLASAEVAFYEFFPLYDVLHLGNVVIRGHSPTGGEMFWAVFDVGFVIADVLSLAALQPEGVAASEAARSQLKAATRGSARALGRRVGREADEAARALAAQAGRETAEVASERAARWWAVRSAGGLYRTLKQYPEALGRLSFRKASELAAPLCRKSGLKLSTWEPLRFVQDGAVVLKRLPTHRGFKYLALEAGQASVGIVAISKMEEHLSSRRPVTAAARPLR